MHGFDIMAPIGKTSVIFRIKLNWLFDDYKDLKWIEERIKTIKLHTSHSLRHRKIVNSPTFYKHNILYGTSSS